MSRTVVSRHGHTGLLAILLTGMIVLSTAQAGESPHNNYMIHCQGCHLADGAGAPPDVPSFAGQLDKFLQVDGGRAYLVQVPGTTNAPLNNADIAELLNWMLVRFCEQTLPADFTPYSEQEVARYRGELLLDPAAKRRSLLAALPE
ncbi:MAG: hypothetical protein QGG46_00990 [Gammaproteobacteria bacterium]|jgi:cytochrome c553|nr:hypothetical protein [Gammaproteobacteria bacterium]